MQISGKHAGLITQEQTRAYNEALEEARSMALKEVHAVGAREVAQKGRSYEKMLLSRAEDKAKTKADKEFKSCLMSECSKIALRVEAEIKEEHRAALEEHHTNLAACLAKMDHDAEVKFIRTNTICLGLLDDLDSRTPNPSKWAKVSQSVRIATKARGPARSRTASVSLMWRRSRSPLASPPHKPAQTPTPEPSPCLVAGEDDSTPRGSPQHMDWSDSDHFSPLSPLPTIDFTRLPA
jgi:hypothetical protein